MDKTNLDPGFGVTPARDDTPDERARVGRDYLSALLRHYDGDPAKMWAAYNGGPGALDKALAKEKEMAARMSKSGTDYVTGKPARVDIPGGWIDFMPQETQAYVTKNLTLLDKA